MLKIAHRGSSGREPENTMAAFEHAINDGADMIELDVRKCQSGELVVIHDATLGRTTNGHGWVAHTPLAALKKLDCGAGQSVPTLEEVLNKFSAKISLNIEIKSRGISKQLFTALSKNVGGNRGLQNFLVSSFYGSELVDLRKLSATIRLGLLVPTWPFGAFGFAKKIGAETLHINHRFLTRRVVAKARELGLKVWVWTVDKPQEIAKFKSWGVDGIFSNFPDRL